MVKITRILDNRFSPTALTGHVDVEDLRICDITLTSVKVRFHEKPSCGLLLEVTFESDSVAETWLSDALNLGWLRDEPVQPELGRG